VGTTLSGYLAAFKAAEGEEEQPTF
jgi:hypothetical protein